MDCCVNETLGHKEVGQHISALITTIKDVPQHKTIGEEHQEDKGEVDDCSITPPMPHRP